MVSGRFMILNDGQFSTLEITRAALDDCGVYTATSTNEHGSVSCHCSLIVDKGIRSYITPTFVERLEPDFIVMHGNEIHLSARIEAYPLVGVNWYRNNIRIRPSRRIHVSLDKDGFIELIISNATIDDAGTYKLVAANAVGSAQCECRVIIQNDENNRAASIRNSDLPYSKEPLFVKKPRSFEAFEGDTVIIDLEVVGDPKPDVIWLRDFLKVCNAQQ